MGYMYNRAELFQSLRWMIGPVLPQEKQEKPFRSLRAIHVRTGCRFGGGYGSSKDPYIRVKVLDGIGEVCLGDRTISLTQHWLHFIKRTDAEPFILQGLMEEFLE